MKAEKQRRGMNLKLMLRAMWKALTDPAFSEQIGPMLEASSKRQASQVAAALSTPAVAKAPPASVAPSPPPPSDALKLVALLQREGRLIDFLMEDIAQLPDAQVGAAVKDIHRQCRRTLLEHLELEGAVAGQEDESFTVPAGFDPSAIRLTGNLSGQPPFQGTLRHRGWRVKKLKLPSTPANTDPMILAPAEVELS